MPEKPKTPINEPKRLKGFMKYFKNYMGLSSYAAAALPIPVTLCQVIPAYKAHTKLLSVYMSLFCFLILGFIFYNRHKMADIYFRRHKKTFTGWKKFKRKFIKLLPLLLIACCFISALLYHGILVKSVRIRYTSPTTIKLISDGTAEENIIIPTIEEITKDILKKTEFIDIPVLLAPCFYLYTHIFMCRNSICTNGH